MADCEQAHIDEFIYNTYVQEKPMHIESVGPAKERIVRCRDCKHATDDGYGCKLFSHYERGAYYQWEDVPAEVEPDGFCKWGERKAGDE